MNSLWRVENPWLPLLVGVNRKVTDGKCREHWSELEEMLVKSMVHIFCRNSERTSCTDEQLCCVKTSTGFSSPWSS